MQSPEIEYPDIYDYLINTPSKSERATQFLVSLCDFLGFLFLKRLIEELQIIVAKKLIAEFCLVFDCFESRLDSYSYLATYHYFRFTTIVATLTLIV